MPKRPSAIMFWRRWLRLRTVAPLESVVEGEWRNIAVIRVHGVWMMVDGFRAKRGIMYGDISSRMKITMFNARSFHA